MPKKKKKSNQYTTEKDILNICVKPSHNHIITTMPKSSSMPTSIGEKSKYNQARYYKRFCKHFRGMYYTLCPENKMYLLYGIKYTYMTVSVNFVSSYLWTSILQIKKQLNYQKNNQRYLKMMVFLKFEHSFLLTWIRNKYVNHWKRN